MGRILDNGDSMGGRDPLYLVHRSGLPAVVDWNHSPRSWRDCRLESTGIDVQRLALTIDEYRSRSQMDGDFSRGCEGHCWDDDLIAMSNAERCERKMKSSRPRIERNGMIGPDVFRKTLLELCCARPCR
jgi:hypothetical protein